MTSNDAFGDRTTGESVEITGEDADELVWKPWRCLCLGLRSHMTYTLRRRRTILHPSQIFLTDERTFITTTLLKTTLQR